VGLGHTREVLLSNIYNFSRVSENLIKLYQYFNANFTETFKERLGSLVYTLVTIYMEFNELSKVTELIRIVCFNLIDSNKESVLLDVVTSMRKSLSTSSLMLYNEICQIELI
jgi:hypothetical protein